MCMAVRGGNNATGEKKPPGEGWRFREGGGLSVWDESLAGGGREGCAVLQPFVGPEAGYAARGEATGKRGLLAVDGGAELRAWRVDVVHGSPRKTAR